MLVSPLVLAVKGKIKIFLRRFSDDLNVSFSEAPPQTGSCASLLDSLKEGTAKCNEFQSSRNLALGTGGRCGFSVTDTDFDGGFDGGEKIFVGPPEFVVVEAEPGVVQEGDPI
jgi:hypothetical protein